MRALRGLLLAACVLPMACTLPTTVGLRSAGDLAPAGQSSLGVGLGAATGETMTAGWVSLDWERSIREGRAVSAGGGIFGGMAQGQAELRFSTQAQARAGLMGMGGLGLMGGIGGALVGPYAGGAGRLRLGRGYGYAGAKVNPVFGTLTSSVWLSPAVGWSSRPGPLRLGVEGVGLAPVAGATVWAPMWGGQLWLRWTPERGG